MFGLGFVINGLRAVFVEADLFGGLPLKIATFKHACIFLVFNGGPLNGLLRLIN